MSAKKTDALTGWLIGATIMFALSPVVIFLAFSSTDAKQEKIASRNQALSTAALFFLGFAGMVNAYYGARRTAAIEKSAIATEKNLEIGIKNTQLAQERLINERLMTAITQLGHENIATRIGAIYSLERVAQDSPSEYWTIMEILTAFLREKTVYKPKLGELTPEISPNITIPMDVQTALTVIGRRNVAQDSQHQKLDLRHTCIPGADLSGANLQHLDFRGADLSKVDLRCADLCETNLEGTQLSGSLLYEANLRSANLSGANLTGANLNRAWICEANLRSANLSGASLRAANLSKANLYKANLQQANLKVANLQAAKLFLVNLQQAKLGKANLQGTGLIGANLSGANLNAANLTKANLNAAKLHQTELLFANLSEASLREADMAGANLMGVNLQKATLNEANLISANLMGANLTGTHLCDTKLPGANLTGVKNLQPTQIHFAWGDRTTILPDYLQPPTHWQQAEIVYK
ncbi:pentapeptide repeat-containing protein [Calothrix sp. 336/3]|uniref:pentapeptide repeat-containing protein n=1 Tax=Calothrix sp. 336/3 TaxID=1337936 RepID=UPI0004E3CCA8|nr:pentapeptide repeat-containing protein [Calothrix sp. 336/3]AKG22437.1 low-complexity protein [Calothrix sp. 336/3]